MSEEYTHKVLKKMYLFVRCEQHGWVGVTGCEEMQDMICAALCNEIGNTEFCDWLETVSIEG